MSLISEFSKTCRSVCCVFGEDRRSKLQSVHLAKITNEALISSGYGCCLSLFFHCVFDYCRRKHSERKTVTNNIHTQTRSKQNPQCKKEPPQVMKDRAHKQQHTPQRRNTSKKLHPTIPDSDTAKQYTNRP